MDWLKIATNDWAFYESEARIAKYVEFGKITPEQYQLITNSEYVA
ncbi:XkdX family protein [Paenibacillus sp. TRM 82003]|nr:XkdX family protein [Paenibacillus sp. TRM 82003]